MEIDRDVHLGKVCKYLDEMLPEYLKLGLNAKINDRIVSITSDNTKYKIKFADKSSDSNSTKDELTISFDRDNFSINIKSIILTDDAKYELLRDTIQCFNGALNKVVEELGRIQYQKSRLQSEVIDFLKFEFPKNENESMYEWESRLNDILMNYTGWPSFFEEKSILEHVKQAIKEYKTYLDVYKFFKESNHILVDFPCYSDILTDITRESQDKYEKYYEKYLEKYQQEK